MGLSDYEWAALALSLKVAGYATLWLLPIGIVLAWVLARTSFIGKGLIDSLVHFALGATACGDRLFIADQHGAAGIYWSVALSGVWAQF